jgi:hypothetical protein
MKPSRRSLLAAKLLERFLSGPHGDALAGDLLEQYRQGRSTAWYWRQVLSAIVVSLASDRTLGGAALLALLLVLTLIIVGVVRHPSSLGIGLFVTDIALLSGDGLFAAWAWRQRGREVRDALIVGAQTGLMVGLIFIAAHLVESFVPANKTAQLVRGAGSTLLMLGLFGVAGSAAWERTRSAILAATAGLWSASVATLIFVAFALSFNLAFEAHAASLLYEPFVQSGMTDAAAFVVRNSLQAISEILIRMPIAALMLSLTGSVSNAWIKKWPRRLAVSAALLTPLIFVFGAFALWYADSLTRAARPPFVMAGVLSAGLALCAAHPIWSSLSHKHHQVPPAI